MLRFSTQQTLTYECLCRNGSEPADIDQYLDTLPNHICQATFAQCREDNPGSDSCVECGTLRADDVPMAVASSSAASSTSMASATEAAEPAAATEEGAASHGRSIIGGAAIGVAGLMGALVL